MIYTDEAKKAYYGTLHIEESKAIDKWLEEDIVQESLSEYGIVNEYAGNELKNNQFVLACQDIEKLIKLFKEDNDQVTKNIEKFLSLYKSAKKSKDFGDLMGTMDDLIKKFNEDSKKRFSGSNGRDMWKALEKTAKKFSTKYSEMGMTTRENFDKKFQTYLEDFKKRKDDLLEKNEELGKAYDKAKKVDYDYAGKIYNRIFNSIDFAFKDCQYTINDLLYTLKLLNVEGIKSSMIYNILNKSKSEQLKKVK